MPTLEHIGHRPRAADSAGRYPKPVRIGQNSARWLKSECWKAMQAMIQARDDEPAK